MGDLTEKQRAFIQEYLIDLNATQAAIRAGYSEDTARSIACENLTKPDIQDAIAKAMQDRAERTQILQDKVVNQLAKIAFVDIKDVVKWEEDGTIKIRPSDEIDGTIIASATSTRFKGDIKKEVKLNDRMKALELLGRHLGMFTEHIKAEVENSGKVEVFLNVPQPKVEG